MSLYTLTTSQKERKVGKEKEGKKGRRVGGGRRTEEGGLVWVRVWVSL